MSSFKYKPLETPETIRLLRLHPWWGDERLSNCLHHVSLYEDPICDGLSYIWRNLIVTQTIVCNDVEARTTSDLYDALNPFRKEDQEVVLWADQLCINESDVQERSQQVRIIGYSYE